jgi:hypothetical protein
MIILRNKVYRYFSIGIIFFFLCKSSVCQINNTNIWYFGAQAGVDFNSGTPVALVNSVMNQYEGCSSIADNSGNLLFYTNGVQVWNINHVQMPNGFGLMGDISPTQSALIVQQPGSNNIYYIFTTDNYEDLLVNGCRYSIVDMTQQSGLGDVTIKNVLLIAPTAEKLTAVKHSNGNDIWVITHEWNSADFYTYLVTSSGVSSTPVISNIGLTHNGVFANAAGYLKTSPDGSKLALAITGNINTIEIFDFNNSTGVITNSITDTSIASPYGIEFSPDVSKLYVSSIQREIYQYDLLAGSSANIINSKTLVATCQPDTGFPILFTYALQLAPDCKIYLSRSPNLYLGVINNPNSLGISCNYFDWGVYLGGKTCQLGLPNFVQSYFYQTCTVGITEPVNNSGISISPNPSSGKFELRITNYDVRFKNAGLGIYNVLGEQVYKSFIVNPTSYIDLSSQPAGIYFIKVQSGSEIFTQKIILQ